MFRNNLYEKITNYILKYLYGNLYDNNFFGFLLDWVFS